MPRRQLRSVHAAGREVAGCEPSADGEVAGGDHRVDLGPEIGGAPVERGEVAGHHRGGHHGDEQRCAPERDARAESVGT